MSCGVISLRKVSKGYSDGQRHQPVIRNLDLDIGPGEVVALCGPSGSGKSTLLNLIAGIAAVDAGSLTLRHQGQAFELHNLGEGKRTALRRRLIGYVFQFFNLVPTLNVLENVALPLHLNGLEQRLPEARRRLQALGLGERLDAFPQDLSGGEQQRAAIARALAHAPAIVLADEPTGNLDGDNSALVAEMLFSEVAELGCALVIATHNQALAARAHRLVELGG